MPIWAHLACSVFYSVPELRKVCFRQSRAIAHARHIDFTLPPCPPKSHKTTDKKLGYAQKRQNKWSNNYHKTQAKPQWKKKRAMRSKDSISTTIDPKFNCKTQQTQQTTDRKWWGRQTEQRSWETKSPSDGHLIDCHMCLTTAKSKWQHKQKLQTSGLEVHTLSGWNFMLSYKMFKNTFLGGC